MALLGTPSSGGDKGAMAVSTSEDYQKQYQDVRDAAQYNAEYRDQLFKRMSTAREFSLIRRQLATQGHNSVILDLPCGGGRLSPQIGEFTDLLIEADIAVGQVLHGKETSRLSTPQLWMTASAFHLPFRDGSVDGTVSCRLCHHLPTAKEREALMAEILRVSRKFVLMTYFDYRSVKNVIRRIRSALNKNLPPKMTMKYEEVEAIARKYGARLVNAPYLANFSSGHRYALMVKEG
jgi:SAM-dependent methyltransferase